jgi:hypothetical protein
LQRKWPQIRRLQTKVAAAKDNKAAKEAAAKDEAAKGAAAKDHEIKDKAAREKAVKESAAEDKLAAACNLQLAAVVAPAEATGAPRRATPITLWSF